MKIQFKKFVLSLVVLGLTTVTSFAQSELGSNVKTNLNSAWTWIQAILTFAIIISTVIGIIVTYQKKNSDQPGEFKKYVIGFASGIVFLIIALSIVSIIKTTIQSSLSTSF